MASGLGRNIAEAVLESGDGLVTTARDTKRLHDLVKKYGGRVRAVPLDVTDESAAQAAVQTAVAAFGRLDVVVNNAGYGDIAPFEQLSAERFKAVMDTNFYGVVNVTRAAVPLMREQRSGCILQISSVGGRLTRPGSTPYHAAKWAKARQSPAGRRPEILRRRNIHRKMTLTEERIWLRQISNSISPRHR